MVKLIYCITKKPELSVEEFQRYWREVHAPIAAAIPGARFECITDAAHWPQWEHPEEHDRIVTSFLRDGSAA